MNSFTKHPFKIGVADCSSCFNRTIVLKYNDDPYCKNCIDTNTELNQLFQ